jgi:bifunctional non-homologous end joining protein LigD
MQVAAVRELQDGGAWTYEAALDGYRCLAAQARRSCCALVAPKKRLHSTVPGDSHACEKLAAATLIDGEVVAIDANGRISFNALQHSCTRTHLQFYAFDVLVHPCRGVLQLPLEARRELLADALAKVEYPVLRSTAFDTKPRSDPCCKEMELEGVVAKRKGSLYEPGRRSGAWLKYKINHSQEFVIGGYPAGNPFDPGANQQFPTI